MSKKFKIILLALLMILITGIGFLIFNKPEPAAATWWNDSWSYRKALVINHAQVAGDLTDFPVLVSLTDTNLSGHAQEDGDDFIFIDSSGEKLKHEIESYASSTGVLVAWVKIPSLSSTADTEIFMYYGNQGIGNQESGTEVWDDNYKMIQHHEEVSGTLYDSTSNNNDGASTTGMTYATSTKIGQGLYFDESDDYYAIDDFFYGDTFTMSMWVKVTDNLGANIQHIFYHSQDTAGFDPLIQWYIREDSVGNPDDININLRDVYENNEDMDVDVSAGDTNITDGNWYYFTLTRVRNGTNNIYINAQSQATSSAHNSTMNPGDSIFIANNGSWDASAYFGGQMDEIRISSVERSQNWITTEYNNQNSPSTFFSEQSEETGPGPVGYWSFDAGYGTTAQDSSSNNNDGTITGATWQDESMCISGKCLYFDGVDLTRVDADVPDNMDEFTACTWFKANSFTNEDSDTVVNLLGKDWYFRITNAGKLEFGMVTSGSYPFVSSNENLDINKWYYTCVEYNGIGVNPILYINGVDESGTVSGGNGTRSDDSADICRIGASGNEWNRNFNGFIDEVKIYPYARTADQIRQDYNAGLAGISSAHGVSASFGGTSDKWMSDGLVGYWQMDESTTTSGAIDASGNGNDGTYYGDASTTAGKFGNGGVFDGSGDYIQSNFQFSIFNFQTISQWINFQTLATSEPIAGQWGNSQNAVLIKSDDTNSDEIRVCIASGLTDNCANYGVTTDANISAGTWYHLQTIYNGAQSSNAEKLKIFINGEQKTLSFNGSIPSSFPDSSENFEIGGDSDLADYTDIKIDEVRIYNRALSPDEVRKLYEWAPGPVAHWKFDEKSGTTAYDSIASSTYSGGNDGTIDGATWTRGKYGGALDFDGSDDYVGCGSDESIDDIEPFTISAWIYPRSAGEGNYGTIIAKNEASGPGGAWSVRIYSSGRLKFYKDYSTTDLQADSAVGAYSLNIWQYVTFIWDGGNDASEDIDFYVNGIEKSHSWDADASGTINSESIEDCFIGSNEWSTETFDGLIDDVRIYNYARTQKQILEDMMGSSPSAGSGRLSLNAPVLHLDFDEGFGGTAHDSSIHNNDGTLYPGTGGTNTATSAMWTKNGKLGQAIEFDGNDDWVDIGQDVLGIPTELSLSAWIKKDADTVGYIFYGNTRPYLYSDDRLRFKTDNTNLDSSMLNIGEWYHIVATNNGSTSKIYLNGKLDVSAADAVSNGDNIMIGTFSGSNFFNGLIDEVKIYNYALTLDEVKTLYNQGQAAIMGQASSADDDGTTVTGAGIDYCIPGDTATCSPPVLELKFDEKSGTTTYDTSGQGNDGVFVSSATSPTWTRGKYGSALSFDGSDDYVRINQSSSINDLGPLTMNAWIYPKSIGQNDNGIIFCKHDYGNADGNICLRLRTSNRINFTKDYNTTDMSVVTESDIVTLNQWNFVSLTWNGGTDASDDVKIYINSIADNGGSGSYYQDGVTTVNSDSGNNLYIGNTQNGNRTFDGFIDDIKIYDYARTPAQIAWDYNRGKPIAHWKFDECSGGTIHNATHNTQHGTLHLGTAGVTATGTCASSSDSFWYNGRDGKINSSGSFDGGSDYVNTTLIDLSGTDAVSLSFWMKHTFEDNNSTAFEFSDNFNSYTTGFGFFPDDNAGTGCRGQMLAAVRGSNWNAACFTRPSSDEWHHYVILYDKSQPASNEIAMYINGEIQIVTYKEYSGNNTNNFGNHNFYMMSRGGTTEYEDGYIDEVKIFNYALTAEQVRTEYNGGAVRFGE